MSTAPPTRVVVVEDSPVQRAHIVAVLQATGQITVVAEAADVPGALEAVRTHRPQLVTMDLELPGGITSELGGVEAIRTIMAERPTPILVLSVHTPSRESGEALVALDAGAIDVLPKASAGDGAAAETLRRRVRVLSGVPMVRRPRATAPVPTARVTDLPVIALAASTGGPGALRTVVAELRGVGAPVLVVQHIHAEFVESFARWLQETTLMPVTVPGHREAARPGVVYVAPADTHLRLGPGRTLELDPEPELLSRPSADELLSSVAAHAGPAAVGAVLTGMGDDGARGLLAIRQAGGRTFAQDGESATVDGMPRAARDLGAAERVMGLEQIGRSIAAIAAGGR
ncbi:chemotaxis protein CheB [Conexibacter sp. SYSU D00693]|uniref:chemotaxis protein CheB n=1 Tax=Conexibacter sp. SYSU D00693 TaxID=2812560 RepID=UPI00196AA04F|nr:chemotaxis protein CheB [Conexibacter sp. SYSU D00693]